MDPRACRPIILDPSRPGPARPRRRATTSRHPGSARLPGHDPRPQAGLRAPHPLVAILAMAAAAVLAGARSMTAIAEWAADAPQPVRAALGARRDGPDRWVVPAEATIRRTLTRVDPTALAAVLGTWLADRDGRTPQQRRRAVAVDGKTLRGARRDGRPAGPPAGRDGPHHPRRPRPTPGQRRARRGPRLPAAAGRPGPRRDGGHRRRVAHPPGRRLGSW
jgi:hypothetical protein